MLRTIGLCLFSLLVCSAALAQTLEADLRALESLRNGNKTPLDAVDRRGGELLEQYQEPVDQALIHYDLAHIHAQSGLKRPDQVIKHARAALDSKLITPEQRGTLYSYLASAHEVRKDVKDFAERRRNALQPLLAGLAELEAMKLPAKSPEIPALLPLRDGFGDPAEEARARAAREAAQAAREQAQRFERLVFRRKTLQNQVKWLYYRDPVADDELRELAGEKLSEELAQELVEAAQGERERIEKARKER